MRNRFSGSMIAAAIAGAAVSAVILLSVTRTSGQAARPARTADGKPNFSGIWQAFNEANWDLEAHEARPAAVTQPGIGSSRVAAAPVVALGAVAGVPASLGVVEGDGRIPYKPETAAIKKENAEHWIDRDPEIKCYLPGVPRAMYMPYPFQIIQGTNKIQIAFAYESSSRTIHLDKVDPPPADTFMGHSAGHWEGNTLVVDVTGFNGKSWFDRAGNYQSDALHVVERYTPMTPDAIHYEVTIEDPNLFTRPWKISMPLYRRLEPSAQLLEYRCVDFAEEFLYGHVRKTQLVKHWEGETMEIDVKRKVPPGDKFYQWYRK
jgi:hypothetical protein